MFEQNGIEELFEKEKCDIIRQVAKTEGFVDYSIKTSVGSSKGDNYLGILEKITIEGKRNDGVKDILDLIVKIPPKGSRLRDEIPLNRFYVREVFAYKELLPELDSLYNNHSRSKAKKVTFAKCYEADATNLCEILVLEDLNVQDYVMFDRLKPFDYEHINLIIKTIAKYHALSFAAKDKCPEVYTKKELLYNDIDKKYGAFDDMIVGAIEKAVGILDNPEHERKLRAFTTNAENILEKKFSIESKYDDGYRIIVHGDCWTNNFLFKYEEDKPVDMILLDWQMMKYASPVTDLAYFIFSCIEEEIREEHLDEIFANYYSILRAELIDLGCDPDKSYPEEIFEKHIKELSSFGLLCALMMIPLLLSKKEDAVYMDDLFQGDKVSVDLIVMSKESIKRLRSVIKYFVDSKLI